MPVFDSCSICGSDGPFYRVKGNWMCETCAERAPDALAQTLSR